MYLFIITRSVLLPLCKAWARYHNSCFSCCFAWLCHFVTIRLILLAKSNFFAVWYTYVYIHTFHVKDFMWKDAQNYYNWRYFTLSQIIITGYQCHLQCSTYSTPDCKPEDSFNHGCYWSNLTLAHHMAQKNHVSMTKLTFHEANSKVSFS